MDSDLELMGAERREALKAWLFVCGLALGFFLYGLFMFASIGDRGPPAWDFNIVEDTPGKSVYSTFPEPGGAREPEPQHIAGRPSRATAVQEKEEK
jgi:hypothetical protein